jgi:hypothetical protein
MSDGIRVAVPDRHPLLFNSPLETGVRTLMLLVAAHPSGFDLDRLVQLDHLVVHIGDLGLGESLHPNTPRRATEMIVRRKVVQDGLLLMESRGLADRQATGDGVTYHASDAAAEFIGWLKSGYMRQLQRDAAALIRYLGQIGPKEFERQVAEHFERWSMEFQRVETPASGA